MAITIIKKRNISTAFTNKLYSHISYHSFHVVYIITKKIKCPQLYQRIV